MKTNPPPRTRRQLLQGAGVTLALPFLQSQTPVQAAENERRLAPESDGKPRRAVFICNNLGLHMPYFVPEQTGFDYTPSPYLEVLGDLRKQMTVFSGISHPSVDGGHAAEKSFLTAAPHPGSGSFRNSISVDQLVAESLGSQTRIPSLVLSANGGGSLSWTRSGVPIPGEESPSKVFRKLFTPGSSAEIDDQITRLRQGASVMDMVMNEAANLRKKLSRHDREKFDEYTTSVREVEQEMMRQQEWERKPKPQVDAKEPTDIRDQADTIGRSKLMYDLIALALQTDSTRIATVMSVGWFAVPPIAAVTEGYHTLSHHGKNKEKLAQLAIIEKQHLGILRDFLAKLDATKEEDDTLLDRTMVLFGSDLGNASSHNNTNVPVVLAGGGFKHGQHLGFDRTNNEPLSNIYVSMLQRMGLPIDRFGSSTGTIRGLEMTS
ncbi:DUF1552 domain-containing protein [Stieleria sp. TO1_6]|uniref:DUF1552 domain-containing protein n=1 Tax=Stieleria tagensis TaxID=2956795 RepID=UPI00209A6BD3|nr:DUF1552 domain-containing protein [Stieleria tagensis]MCO8124564.1 DUF1552 domain-containing protein [Stieleria tagensis]